MNKSPSSKSPWVLPRRDALRETCSTLERVAAQFPRESAEHKAIELAAHSLCFMESRRVRAEFNAYIKSLGKELGRAKLRKLRKLGIDV